MFPYLQHALRGIHGPRLLLCYEEVPYKACMSLSRIPGCAYYRTQQHKLGDYGMLGKPSVTILKQSYTVTYT